MLPLILLPDLCTLPISSNFHLCTKAIQKEKNWKGGEGKGLMDVSNLFMAIFNHLKLH